MSEHTSYLTLTDENFYDIVVEARPPVLVDFWADWCGPCHMIAPTIEELAREYQGQVIVGKLDVDENPYTTNQYGVRSIPTLILFKNGQVVDRVIGAVPKQILVGKLNALTEAA